MSDIYFNTLCGENNKMIEKEKRVKDYFLKYFFEAIFCISWHRLLCESLVLQNMTQQAAPC